MAKHHETKFCSSCGKEIHKDAEICPKCGVGQHHHTKHDNKNSGLAAILSVIVIGLGQIYNGQIGKGILFMILAGVCVVLFLIGIGVLLFFILWVYNVYDAYTTAEKINSGEKV